MVKTKPKYNALFMIVESILFNIVEIMKKGDKWPNMKFDCQQCSVLNGRGCMHDWYLSEGIMVYGWM